MKKLLLFSLAFILLLLPSGLWAQQQNVMCPLAAGAAQASFTATTRLIIAPTVPTSRTIYINGVPTADLSTTPAVHICRVVIQITQTATPADFSLVTGTGTNCATGQAQLTPIFKGTASIQEKFEAFFSGPAPLNAPKAKDVCVKLATNVPTGVVALINYGAW